jgi:hypothetical protein
MSKKPLLPILAALALAACETWDVDKYDVKLAHKYPVPEDANQNCKDAAAKARRWCRDVNVPTDTTWAENCRTAQWAYNQACR